MHCNTVVYDYNLTANFLKNLKKKNIHFFISKSIGYIKSWLSCLTYLINFFSLTECVGTDCDIWEQIQVFAQTNWACRTQILVFTYIRVTTIFGDFFNHVQHTFFLVNKINNNKACDEELFSLKYHNFNFI